MNRGFVSSVSGLQAAQAGLYVTGHNVANVNTEGYSRQQAIQSDFRYQGIGRNAFGPLQVGLGTDIQMIRQIRSDYLDLMYRNTVPRATYYAETYMAGNEVENILGELYSSYSTKTVINSMWTSLQELTTHPGGLETRSNFISYASSYLNKMQNAYDRLISEQQNLNNEVIKTVNSINELTAQIHELNGVIKQLEAYGQNANDYRDQRNLCLDQLSQLINIEYNENRFGEVVVRTNGNELVANGFVTQIGLRYTAASSNLVEPVFTNSDGTLKYDDPARSVFSYYGIADDNGHGGTLYGLLVSRGLYETNYNSLNQPDYLTYDAIFDVTDFTTALGGGYYFGLDAATQAAIQLAIGPAYVIPTYAGTFAPCPDPSTYLPPLQNFDDFVADYEDYLAEVQTYINEMNQMFDDLEAAGVDPETLLGAHYADFKAFEGEYIEKNANFKWFKVEYYHWEDNAKTIQFNAEQCIIPRALQELDTLFNYIVNLVNEHLADPTAYDLNGDQSATKIFITKDGSTYFTLSNTILNPVLQQTDGYTYLCLGSTDDKDNGDKVAELLAAWNNESPDIWGLTIDQAYDYIVNDFAIITNRAQSMYSGAVSQVNDHEQKRQAVMGVSLDEELSNMLIYQHAYNACSRMVNVLDSMIDKIVNGTGRVGL